MNGSLVAVDEIRLFGAKAFAYEVWFTFLYYFIFHFMDLIEFRMFNFIYSIDDDVNGF